MSDNESSETSDEEYVPNDVSESDSEEIEESNESDADECQEKVVEVKPENLNKLEEQKSHSEKELWESFKNDVEGDKNISITDSQKDVENTNVSLSTEKKSVAGVSKPNTKRPGISLKTILGGFGQNKKPKMNMLEKSKQDWDKFVTTEGIKDDLKIFNRGKQGFLERKAFEARTEMKQYEREKNLRLQTKPKK